MGDDQPSNGGSDMTLDNAKGSQVQVDAARYARFVKMEEAAEKAKVASQRALVRDRLYVVKAKGAGLTVTDAEVDKYITEHKK